MPLFGLWLWKWRWWRSLTFVGQELRGRPWLPHRDHRATSLFKTVPHSLRSWQVPPVHPGGKVLSCPSSPLLLEGLFREAVRALPNPGVFIRSEVPAGLSQSGPCSFVSQPGLQVDINEGMDRPLLPWLAGWSRCFLRSRGWGWVGGGKQPQEKQPQDVFLSSL